MRDAVASELIRHNLPGLIAVSLQQSFEEALGGFGVASAL